MPDDPTSHPPTPDLPTSDTTDRVILDLLAALAEPGAINPGLAAHLSRRLAAARERLSAAKDIIPPPADGDVRPVHD